MNTALQDTLLQLFQQVTDDPDSMPGMPVNGWQEGSAEWRLLTGFHDMLERIQQRIRHGIEVVMELDDEPDLSLKVKQELYRFAQEALHNIVKHARATRVDLRMHWSPQEFLLEIGNNGVGFDPTSAFPGHLGLHSMRERVTRLGGKLQIESAPWTGDTSPPLASSFCSTLSGVGYGSTPFMIVEYV